MMTLQELTRELVAVRKKPTTEDRFKQYPQWLKQFMDALEICDDIATLREVIQLDSGYYLLAGYRQKVLEKWLSLDRSAEALRLYANQLMLFGNVDEFGEADTETDARVDALLAEADALG